MGRLVKNRCKNGDHWVEAHAAPIVERRQDHRLHVGTPQGSAGRHPAAEAAYALFRDSKAGGLAIRVNGKVVKGG